MKKINLHNRSFKLLNNSYNGRASSQTIFNYKQSGDLVTAKYKGGDILYGIIIAKHCGHYLDMLYQCYTANAELKAGKATAEIGINPFGKVVLDLDWEWLDTHKKGTSKYIEI